MVILHIVNTKNRLFMGVDVVVPEHVKRQQQTETVGLINITGLKVEGVNNQIEFNVPFDVKALPKPFDNPDLVVFHEVYRIQYIKIYKNLLKNKVPYIIVPHGSLTKAAQSRKKLKKIVGNAIYFSKFIKKAVAVQCLSKKEKEQTVIAKRKFVCTNGVDMPKTVKEGFNVDKTELVFIGRYDIQHKGLDFLVDAVKSIEDFILEHGVKISLYGPDNDYKYSAVQQLIKEKGVQNLIEQNTAISREEKENKLLSADIFIQTSRFEGMPMGIIEALSYGVPCLITEGTTLGNIINEYGAGWVAKTNAQDIAKTIKTAVLDKESYITKSRSAIKLAEENFAWDKVIKDELASYNKLQTENKL